MPKRKTQRAAAPPAQPTLRERALAARQAGQQAAEQVKEQAERAAMNAVSARLVANLARILGVQVRPQDATIERMGLSGGLNAWQAEVEVDGFVFRTTSVEDGDDLVVQRAGDGPRPAMPIGSLEDLGHFIELTERA
jgi:hypothetical protein